MKKHLPREFRFSHEFAFFLHDMLANIVVAGEEARIFDVPITLRSQSEADAIESLSGEALLEWFRANGYEWVNLELSYKQVAVALLADLCHFVYEALRCSEKAKLTTAYALLRKPFRENLLYLEWMLADPEDFMRRFYHEGPSSLELSASVGVERKKEIITTAIGKVDHPNWVCPEFIHDLRYKKTAPYGFEGYWNQALHLVTTFRPIATGHRNFNFIFVSAEDRLDLWQHFYSLVPLLLNHTVEVVDALIETIALRVDPDFDLLALQRTAGFILWADSLSSDDREGLRPNLIKDVADSFTLKCANCSKDIRFGKRNLKSFYRRGEVTCGACHARVSFS